VAPFDKQLAAHEAAIKSIRRTGLYGYNSNFSFEWPKAEDLQKMVKNMPKKIADFRHKTSTTEKDFFGAFQVVLSNGMASPVVKAIN
jgi:hypothetical protein